MLQSIAYSIVDKIPAVLLQSITYIIAANQKSFIVIRQIPWSPDYCSFSFAPTLLIICSTLKMKNLTVCRKLVSSLAILAKIFDRKCSADNKYLIDSSFWFVIWWLKPSLLLMFRPISTSVNRERYRDPAVWKIKLMIDWWLVKKSWKDALTFYWAYRQLFTNISTAVLSKPDKWRNIFIKASSC